MSHGIKGVCLSACSSRGVRGCDQYNTIPVTTSGDITIFRSNLFNINIKRRTVCLLLSHYKHFITLQKTNPIFKSLNQLQHQLYHPCSILNTLRQTDWKTVMYIQFNIPVHHGCR